MITPPSLSTLALYVKHLCYILITPPSFLHLLHTLYTCILLYSLAPAPWPLEVNTGCHRWHRNFQISLRHPAFYKIFPPFHRSWVNNTDNNSKIESVAECKGEGEGEVFLNAVYRRKTYHLPTSQPRGNDLANPTYTCLARLHSKYRNR